MFAPHERVFLPGASGEPTEILRALFASSAEIVTSFVPGVNPIPDDRRAGVESLFGQRGTTALPIAYGAFARDIGSRVPIDTAIIQVSAPDARGRVSFGPAVEFGPSVLAVARRRIAVINHTVAFSAAAPTLTLADFCEVVESELEPPRYAAGFVDPVSTAIATIVAAFIDDGCALQVGLGKVPTALVALLANRRRLRLHSGMLSNGVEALVTGGALDPNWPHLSTVFLGDRTLYDWAAGQSLVRLAGCEVTHDPARLASIDGLVAVNSALQVDLFGQCNLEFVDSCQVSGCGGAPDFSRAARLSRGGLSVVALPSSYTGGSRIVVRLGTDAATTIPRHDVDVIVTEHGAADLRGKNSAQRAEAIIAIAAPDAGHALAEQWRATGTRRTLSKEIS